MIISQTPLRMSFVGGGTDFEDFYTRYPGRVLSSTLDKYYFIAVNGRFDGALQASYSRVELVNHRDEIEHPLIKAALEEAGIEKGIDIVSLCDLPAKRTGLGLGASSSFTVGLLCALFAFKGQQADAEILAEKACEIEIKIANAPIGKQDQYAAAFGGLNVINFDPDGRVRVQPIRLSARLKKAFNGHLLLFFTGIERSASSILKEQKENISERFEILKSMAEMVPRFRLSLERGEFKKLGELLHQGWLAKKQLASKITNPQIEEMYHLAREAGAWGGKILGAGGGGFLLVMAPPEKHLKITQALKDYQLIPFSLSERGSRVILETKRG